MTLPRLGGLSMVAVVLSLCHVAAAGDARLAEAARKADKAAVRALMKQGADVNAPHGDGSTALHWAAYWDDVETVDLLLRAGAKVNAVTDLGLSPLWVACTSGSAGMVDRLLEAHADPNTVPPTGETPLMMAARVGNAAAVKSLLAHGAALNRQEASGQTALMWAVAHMHPDVVSILVQHGANLHLRSRTWPLVVNTGGDRSNIPDPVKVEQGGFTALLFAARQGDLESARILVDAGANVNDSAPAGLSALVVAAHSGHGEVAGFLLEKGADPNAADAGYTALHAAVLRGDGRLVKQLLAHKANVSTPVAKSTPNRRASPDYVLNKAQVGATPLWLSAHFLEPDIMKALVAGGADPLFTKDKATALMAVIRSSPRRGGISLDPRDEERRTLEAISFLVQLGVDVNAANPAGDTVMHMAAAGRKSNAVIQRLVDSGARLDVKNKKEQTPLAIATTPLPRSLGSPAPKEGLDDAGARVADLLRKLGAKE